MFEPPPNKMMSVERKQLAVEAVYFQQNPLQSPTNAESMKAKTVYNKTEYHGHLTTSIQHEIKEEMC